MQDLEESTKKDTSFSVLKLEFEISLSVKWQKVEKFISYKKILIKIYKY